MGKINGHDVLADGEGDGSRPGANSPDPGGRPGLDEENTGFEFAVGTFVPTSAEKLFGGGRGVLRRSESADAGRDGNRECGRFG
jgi:hypothetical protein